MIKWLRKKKKREASSLPYSRDHIQEDEVELQLEDMTIKLSRKLNLFVPHEITVVIPRVELRDRQYANGELVSEQERIYNSVTLVHAPRHPRETLPEFAGKPPGSYSPLPGPKNKKDHVKQHNKT